MCIQIRLYVTQIINKYTRIYIIHWLVKLLEFSRNSYWSIEPSQIVLDFMIKSENSGYTKWKILGHIRLVGNNRTIWTLAYPCQSSLKCLYQAAKVRWSCAFVLGVSILPFSSIEFWNCPDGVVFFFLLNCNILYIFV